MTVCPRPLYSVYLASESVIHVPSEALLRAAATFYLHLVWKMQKGGMRAALSWPVSVERSWQAASGRCVVTANMNTR